MKILKVLSVFTIAALLFIGCKSDGSETAAPAAAPAPTPTQTGEVDLGSTDIGADHTTAKAAETIAAGSIEKAADGYTVEEMYTKKSELAGKSVSVKGKVVKFSGGIMGSNWIHLQDGTGSSVDGTNDLTVTTQGTATVDSIVTITGTLTADKDFGAGYKYSVIIEDAEVKAE